MREIKFRVWDARDRVWLNKERANLEIHNILCYDEYLVHFRYVPVQYTGLKDKNGKEIYEGDIILIKAEGNWEVKFGMHYTNSGDYYTSQAWGFYLNQSEDTESFCDYIMDLGEVIGNIYENSELLEE